MNNRYWLFQRHGVFYLQDAHTREKESLRTRNRRDAGRIGASLRADNINSQTRLLSYAKRAPVKIPSLEEYEKRAEQVAAVLV